MSEQEILFNTTESDAITRVDGFKFADKPNPIKGYPELHWRGKRPFTSTQYYPAQLKEAYGQYVDGWRNKIYWGDNMQVMSHLLREYRGKVILATIDPPFDSKADYKKKISLRGKELSNDRTSFEEKQYTDIWSNDEYLQFMYERLILMRELLSDTGSLFLHCDWHKSHHLRCMLDQIFGENKIVNEIIWHYRTYIGNTKDYFPRKHDTLFWYAKGESTKFTMEYSDNYADTVDYKRWEEYIVNGNQIRGHKYPSTDSRFMAYYDRWVKQNGRTPTKDDVIMEVRGYVIDDVWMDIQAIDPKDKEERIGYPTQKPESLLERIIKASTNPGDLVFDCFMGSGTTQAVAMKLGRRFIGADINQGAIQTTTKRLIAVAKDIQEGTRQPALGQESEETFYTGFEVYNVNHYDIFRNPVEAKDLLLEALEVQRLDKGMLFDGEKDGRMIKIMPVNRIATRSDLNELIAGFDYKAFQRRQEEAPGKPVEKITLVCMGHEPDLAAILKTEVQPYKLDVEVTDILRDKQVLQFKREAEARIVINDGVLTIEAFYPMNLLQKLSIQAEDMQNDWRELVESVMVDWYYDGAVLQPTVVDVPEAGKMVSGQYAVPEDAGRIRVKITDLLSESLEIEVGGNG